MITLYNPKKLTEFSVTLNLLFSTKLELYSFNLPLKIGVI